MVESVGRVGVGRVGAGAGSRMTMGDNGPTAGPPDRAKRVARRCKRLASEIIGRSASSIPSARNSSNKLSALSF